MKSSYFLYRNFSYEDVHVEGTERIAEAVAKYDVDRYIHVSSYNANVDSTSEYFRTKVRVPPALFGPFYIFGFGFGNLPWGRWDLLVDC